MIKLPEGIGFTIDDLLDESLFPMVRAETLLPRLNAKLPALFEAWVKREGVKMLARKPPWLIVGLPRQVNTTPTKPIWCCVRRLRNERGYFR